MRASLMALLLVALVHPVLADESESAAPKPAPKASAPKASAPAPKASAPAAASTTSAEPEHITIQHVLIGFAGSVPGKNITRTQDEAKTLAHQILDRAKKGEDFDALVKQYTDDQAPGIYSMSNNGVTPAQGEYPRNRMVPAFGNAGFPLKVGEIGIAEYDPQLSPYGWHIVKRIK